MRWFHSGGIFAALSETTGELIVEAMRAGGYNLGGEQSGHIVMTDYTTTGDGLIAALLLSVYVPMFRMIQYAR